MPITTLYASILGIFIILLALYTVKGRRAWRIGLGDGDKTEMNKRIRIHGNAVEYIPIALILLGLLESNGGSAILLHSLGSVLVVARLLHAWGISQSAGTTFGRVTGTLFTWLMILTCAGVNLYMVLLAN